ncbi:MAG: Maf family protein [Candidatus Saccharimonadales bacterium]
MDSKKIILASQSPRRRDLLTQMGLQFETIPSNYEEKLDDRPAEELAIELALGKAQDIARRYPDAYVIGSDTIVTVSGHHLEKPLDAAMAFAMLQEQAGKLTTVTTGVVIVCQNENLILKDCEVTQVFFKPYDSAAVAAYVATGDSLDKAGAYGIQSGAAPLIDHIKGQLDNVIGLPTQLVFTMLQQLGIDSQPVHLVSPVPQEQ